MICIHHNDADGRCAAAIVRRALGSSVLCYKMDYKDPMPDDSLFTKPNGEKEDLVVIVDFSFFPENMAHIREMCKEVVWIDHHKTAERYPYQDLPGLRDFRDKSMSGCELTWDYYFPVISPPYAVRLIGDYDKWALELAESKEFYEGLKLFNHSPNADIWEDLFSDHSGITDEVVKVGKIAMRYRDNYCRNLCDTFGYEAKLDGITVFVCNQYMFGSGGFGGRFKEYPACAAFIYDGDRFTVSLYSETTDVGEIAKKYGGGGHKGAAGFVCKELPWRKI